MRAFCATCGIRETFACTTGVVAVVAAAAAIGAKLALLDDDGPDCVVDEVDDVVVDTTDGGALRAFTTD